MVTLLQIREAIEAGARARAQLVAASVSGTREISADGLQALVATFPDDLEILDLSNCVALKSLEGLPTNITRIELSGAEELLEAEGLPANVAPTPEEHAALLERDLEEVFDSLPALIFEEEKRGRSRVAIRMDAELAALFARRCPEVQLRCQVLRDGCWVSWDRTAS